MAWTRQELIRKAAPTIEREQLLKQQVAPGHCLRVLMMSRRR